MTDLVSCKKCGSKACWGCGHEIIGAGKAYVFSEIMCLNSKCGNYVKVQFSPGIDVKDVSEAAAMVWNKYNISEGVVGDA